MAAPAPAPAPAPVPAKVTVPISPGSSIIGHATDKVESFRGIPYASAARLQKPRRVPASALGPGFDATGPGRTGPQRAPSAAALARVEALMGFVPPILVPLPDQTEDCLAIDLWRPAGTKAGDKLPVLFWIYGGGFEFGSTVQYDGSALVSHSADLAQPILFAAVSYRLNAFGFLPGREVLAAGAANLGLLDQRAALEWVADHVALFGGDPDRVTLFGQSAGAISALDQMLLRGGDNTHHHDHDGGSSSGRKLFHAAIMNSGTIVPAEPVDSPKAQAVYDAVVRAAGLSHEADTLAALRALPLARFQAAVGDPSVPEIMSRTGLALSFPPRPDGAVLPASPDQQLVRSGRYAAVPMISGSQLDEATLFCLFQTDVNTADDIVEYLHTLYFPGAERADLQALVDTYDASPAAGSPFGTGEQGELYPGFKRLSAILGDIVFTLRRRAFLSAAAEANPDVPSWSYLASYDSGTPLLGALHGGDVVQLLMGLHGNHASRVLQTYYINFVNNFDPNVGAGDVDEWPRWNESRQLLGINKENSEVIADDFREESYKRLLDSFRV